jgi:uncharacterized protein (DUF433 family)
MATERFPGISRDISVMGGKACIEGTRVTVGMIVMQIGEGKLPEELLVEFPYLKREDIANALKYAAWTVDAREAEVLCA